jgi:hypothetical protein
MIDSRSYLYGVLTVLLPLLAAVIINWYTHNRRWNALRDGERRREDRRKSGGVWKAD